MSNIVSAYNRNHPKAVASFSADRSNTTSPMSPALTTEDAGFPLPVDPPGNVSLTSGGDIHVAGVLADLVKAQRNALATL